MTPLLRTLVFGALIFWAKAPLAAVPQRLDFAPIGPHYPILTFEKNENPQNIMKIYVRLDPSCHFINDEKGRNSPLGFYWLMNGHTYKRVHPLIQSAIRHRLQLEGPTTATNFHMRLAELSDVSSGLDNPVITVHAQPNPQGGCSAEAEMDLPGDRTIRATRLIRVYTESRKTFFPPFRKVVSITLEGVDAKTGAPDVRIFKSKNN